jgi:hypothetical protein
MESLARSYVQFNHLFPTSSSANCGPFLHLFPLFDDDDPCDVQYLPVYRRDLAVRGPSHASCFSLHAYLGHLHWVHHSGPRYAPLVPVAQLRESYCCNDNLTLARSH